MKKILLILCLIVPTHLFGATMCVKDNTVSFLLDSTIGGTNHGSNNTYSTWWASFPYGTIRGISACLSSNNGKSMGGYVSKLTDTDPETEITSRVVGGETNGLHCWCKMTHPAVSRWVFFYSYSSLDECARYCAIRCGNYARLYAALRGGLFGSVAQ